MEHEAGPVIMAGIDPGLSGALAFGYSSGKIKLLDIPTLTIAGAKKSRREINVTSLLEMITEWYVTMGPTCPIAVEWQQAMPDMRGRKQGATSTFRTGFNYGLIIGLLESNGIPYHLVSPVSWKRGMMADMPKEKSASIVAAKRIFPQSADQLTRKKDDGRADALLIAEYARRRSLS